jgi:uncharacterized protein (DUF1501 family)
MLSRREFLERSLKASSLFALGTTVPVFVANAAAAAKPGKDRILVVVQLGGGNDGLNTVVPFGDDEYHKARPTLGLKQRETIKVGDGIGLNNALRGMDRLHQDGQLGIVLGVGYPNPNRSHFESMDIWHTADPRRKRADGWLGRSIAALKTPSRGIPAFHIGEGDLPLALKGSSAGVPSLNTGKPFGLDVGGDDFGTNLPEKGSVRRGTFDVKRPEVPKSQSISTNVSDHKQLIRDVANLAPRHAGGMLDFVRQTSLETYTSIDRLREVMKGGYQPPEDRERFLPARFRSQNNQLQKDLNLVARMIHAGFGTRIFFLRHDGFDTHVDQRKGHDELLQSLGIAVGEFFRKLKENGHADRVTLTTFSEFGRRVRENGSRGTDHGSGSCLFVAGPGVKGGLVGKHPSLKPGDLASGDVKFHTDFRRVYATLLDGWLECDSRHVLGEKFEHVKLLKAPAAKTS